MRTPRILIGATGSGSGKTTITCALLEILKRQGKKVHLLGANRSYDRDEQTVSVNQVVMLEGYSYDSYVVYEVSRIQ